MFKRSHQAGTTGLKKSGPLAVIAADAPLIPPPPAAKKKPASGKAKGHWFFGMMAGQILFFALALRVLPLFEVPPVAVLPVLFGAALTGGVLGGFVHARLTAKTASPPPPMRSYIFQALAETNRKLAEMFVDEEFNAAANNNTDRRKMKARPELKVAAPTPPRMGGM